MPWKQPAMAMISPNTGALISVCHRSVSGTTSRMRWTKVIGGMSSAIQVKMPPPSTAIIAA
ncbi:hypothetical protein D3C83_259440 [compost metagenome]